MVMFLARWRRILGRTVTVALLAACTDSRAERDTPSTAATDSATTPGIIPPAPPAAVPLVTGPFLFLPEPDGAARGAVVIRPEADEAALGDTAGVAVRLAGLPIAFYSRAGLVGTTELSGALRFGSESADCSGWPVATIPASARISAPWLVALPAGHITPWPLDSLDGVAPRDSALWAAALTALASRLPDDTSRTFRSRPYVVDRAWRLASVADTGVIVATLVRRVNQEDAPREERVLLVVDVPAPDPRSWRVGWHERAEGEEDALEVAEPLVAFLPRDGTAPHLLFGRDDGEGVHAALLVRQRDGWQLLWESARPGCR